MHAAYIMQYKQRIIVRHKTTISVQQTALSQIKYSAGLNKWNKTERMEEISAHVVQDDGRTACIYNAGIT